MHINLRSRHLGVLCQKSKDVLTNFEKKYLKKYLCVNLFFKVAGGKPQTVKTATGDVH